MDRIELKSLPPAEAIKYFRDKGLRVGFDWRDVWQEEHAKAFTVAKATRLDVLEDIRDAVDGAIADGTTFNDFKKRLTPTLREKGWWGAGRMIDPLTGKQRRVQLGSPRRLRTIFDVNMRVAYAAGNWQRIQRLKKSRPWLRYTAVMDTRTRPLHAEWHDTVLPADDAWWSTHYPPNGWRCRCKTIQLSTRDLKRFGFAPAPSAPAAATKPYLNKRTGETIQVPVGIDPGWAYNVGQASSRGLVPPPIGGAPTAFQAFENLPPLAAARRFPANRILDDGTTSSRAIAAFLANFGVKRSGSKPARPVHFEDKVGERLVISEDLFRAADGSLKIGRGRKRFVNLLAETIREPDEIWWLWEQRRDDPSRSQLRRRYIARFNVAGRERPAIAVFETGHDGWKGVTTFPADDAAYLEGQRKGVLAYRRK